MEQKIIQYFKLFLSLKIFNGTNEKKFWIKIEKVAKKYHISSYINNCKISSKFEGNCLKQDKESFTYGNVVNFFNFYELDTWLRDLNADFTLKDYLFGAVKLRMQILINILILDVLSRSIDVHFFKFQILIEVKILFLV